jgi:hypothetical protein
MGWRGGVTVGVTGIFLVPETNINVYNLLFSMKSRTHRNISKFLYPHIPFKTIEKVNSAIDNPDRKMVMFQNSGIFDPKYMDLFGLTKHGGHRKYNHSIPSAFMAAYTVDPTHAAELAVAHLFADKMSNMMHDRLGSANKDIAESMLNKQYEMFRLMSVPKRRRKTFLFD